MSTIIKKSLVSGYINGKELKSIYIGNNLVWTSNPEKKRVKVYVYYTYTASGVKFSFDDYKSQVYVTLYDYSTNPVTTFSKTISQISKYASSPTLLGTVLVDLNSATPNTAKVTFSIPNPGQGHLLNFDVTREDDSITIKCAITGYEYSHWNDSVKSVTMTCDSGTSTTKRIGMSSSSYGQSYLDWGYVISRITSGSSLAITYKSRTAADFTLSGNASGGNSVTFTPYYHRLVASISKE